MLTFVTNRTTAEAASSSTSDGTERGVEGTWQGRPWRAPEPGTAQIRSEIYSMLVSLLSIANFGKCSQDASVGTSSRPDCINFHGKELYFLLS